MALNGSVALGSGLCLGENVTPDPSLRVLRAAPHNTCAVDEGWRVTSTARICSLALCCWARVAGAGL